MSNTCIYLCGGSHGSGLFLALMRVSRPPTYDLIYICQEYVCVIFFGLIKHSEF